MQDLEHSKLMWKKNKLVCMTCFWCVSFMNLGTALRRQGILVLNIKDVDLLLLFSGQNHFLFG